MSACCSRKKSPHVGKKSSAFCGLTGNFTCCGAGCCSNGRMCGLTAKDPTYTIEPEPVKEVTYESMQLELREINNEISTYNQHLGHSEESHYKMLQRLLETHGDAESEGLLTLEQTELCKRLSVQLSVLQQKERDIIRLEQRFMMIETESREQYGICQKHIENYSRENNDFLVRISQLELIIIQKRTQIEELRVEINSIQIELEVQFEIEIVEIQTRIAEAITVPNLYEFVTEFEDEDEDDIGHRMTVLVMENRSLKEQHKSSISQTRRLEKEIEDALEVAMNIKQANMTLTTQNNAIKTRLRGMEANLNASASASLSIDIKIDEKTEITRLRQQNEEYRQLLTRKTVRNLNVENDIYAGNGKTQMNRKVTGQLSSQPRNQIART